MFSPSLVLEILTKHKKLFYYISFLCDKSKISYLSILILSSVHCTVNGNINGGSKMRKKYMVLTNCQFVSIAPFKVIALYLFLFFVISFFTSFLYCSLKSYRSFNYCDSCRSFSVLKEMEIAKCLLLLFAIAFKREKLLLLQYLSER